MWCKYPLLLYALGSCPLFHCALLWALGCVVTGYRELPSSISPILKLIPFSHTNHCSQALLLLSCRGCPWLETSSFLDSPILLLSCFCASTDEQIPAWESVTMCFLCCISPPNHCCPQCKKEGSNEGHVWEVSAVRLWVDGVPHSPEASLPALLTDSWLLPKLHKDVVAVPCIFSEPLIHQLQAAALPSAGR